MKKWMPGLLTVSMLTLVGCADAHESADDELSEGELASEDTEFAEHRGHRQGAQRGGPLGRGRDGGIGMPGGERPGFPGLPRRDGGIARPGGGGIPGFPGFPMPGRDGGVSAPGGGGLPGFPGFPFPGRDGGIAAPGGGGRPGFPGGDRPGGDQTGGDQTGGDQTGGDQTGGDTVDPPPASGGAADACDGLTYDAFGKQLLGKYCTSCHTGGAAPGGVDLSTLDGVRSNKGEVASHAVTTTAMPPPGLPQPSADERAKLGQWLECGPN